MRELRNDESGCHNPQVHLAICRECVRNIHGKQSEHRLWMSFAPTKINTSEMAPGSPNIVCDGYLS